METYLNSPACKNEMILCKSLHIKHSEDNWMATLKAIESKRNLSSFDSLLSLKALIPSILSVQALRNLVQLFVRKVSSLMEELNIPKNEKLAKQTHKIVDNFWSLVSNQHVVITQQTFGSYSPLFFEVLPSLASVYVDLFIAVHSTKGTIDKAAKRLYSWLMFELNERCLKTALLEVYECTKEGARILLPLLRKLLLKPPDNTSDLDYLLHFILLKRWSFVCTELCDLFQTSLNIKASRDFLKWLTRYWPMAAEYFPSDKSLNGRRVSELLLELDQKAVEDLIDVFSQCLWSKEHMFEEGFAVNPDVKQNEQGMINEIFTIDKRGTDREEIHLAEHMQPLMKKRKLWHNDKNGCNSALLSDNSSPRQNDSDIFMLDDSCVKNSRSEIEIRKSQKEKSKVVSDCESERDILLHDMEYEEHFTEPVFTIIDGMKVQIFDHENKSEAHKTVNEMIDSYKKDALSTSGEKNSRLDSDLYVISSSDDEVIVKPTYTSPPELSSSTEHFSWTILESPNLNALQDSDIDLTLQHSTEYESKENKRKSRGIKLSNNQKLLEFENTIVIGDEDSIADNFGYHNITGFPVELVLSKNRRSMQDKKKLASGDKTDYIKTRLRTKSETLMKSGNLQKIESNVNQRKASTLHGSDSGNDLKDWLRKSPSRLFKKNVSPKGALMKDAEEIEAVTDLTVSPEKTPLIKDLKSGGRKSAGVKKMTATDVFGTPMKTYSRKDRIFSKTDNTPSNLAHEVPSAKASEESQQTRYYLRTNCSHRLLHNELCPTCSPEKVTPTKVGHSH